MEATLTPFTKFLQKVLDEIKEVDTASIFAQPVDISEVSLSAQYLLEIVIACMVYCEMVYQSTQHYCSSYGIYVFTSVSTLVLNEWS